MGFGNNCDDGPIFDVCDSEDKEVYIPDTTNKQDMCDDWVPLTNLLWGDEPTLVNYDKEASTLGTQRVN